MPGYNNTAYWVYVDEFGTVNLQDPTSHLYIEVAVFIKDEDKEKVESGVEDICNELCNGAELKSSRIGGDNVKRLNYLNKLGHLPFQYIALICNKQYIDKNSGLQYKKTAYKFLHKKLNQIFYQLSGNVNFFIDKYGTKEFEKSCKSYFEKNNQELFCPDYSFEYVDDKTNRIIQLADFIAGTLSYCFDKEKKDIHYSSFFRTNLIKHEIDILCYPRQQIPVSDNPPNMNDPNFADDLKKRLYNQAQRFLEINEDSRDEDIQKQWETLKHLFDASEYEDDIQRYIYADELIKQLLECGWAIGKRTFTEEVIGGLRKANIIIAGSPIGYKLALSLDDVNEYLEHDKKIILPMLKKLSKARSNIKMLMNHDILQNAAYEDLKTLIDSLSEARLENYAQPEEFDIETSQKLTNETL